jgi:hypothetical protein
MTGFNSKRTSARSRFTERDHMLNIELHGLNARQRVLADIMWDLEEYEDVERFMAALPQRERLECECLIDMMRMELVEGYRKGMGLENTQEARRAIQSVLDKHKG